MPRFRIHSKQLFLTYPQCPISKEDALEQLKNICPVKDYVIASEMHQDGHYHLHCFIKLSVDLDTSNPRYFDLRGPTQQQPNPQPNLLGPGVAHFVGASPLQTTVYHGNYQGCRSPKKVMKYCTKDGNYISNFDVAEMMNTWKSKREILGKRIVIDGVDLDQLVREHPELIFGYTKLKMDINNYRASCQASKEILPRWLPNPWGLVLPSKKPTKRRHYWIYSTLPNKGKSFYFAKPLYDEYNGAIKAGDYSYWALNGREEFIILDEYNTAALKWSYINSMCDGTGEYRIFMGGLLKLRDPLIIILSNQRICDLYPIMNTTLYARFNEICVDSKYQ